MKQPGVLITLIVFIAAVSFSLAAEQTKYSGPSLKATLTGSAEVPGPGDPKGTGSFTLSVNATQGQLCYELTVGNIVNATAAHIHSGAPGVAGPVVVMLKAPADGPSKECVSLDEEKATDILKNPGNYYVNVHNADFPNGAIRGQLTK